MGRRPPMTSPLEVVPSRVGWLRSMLDRLFGSHSLLLEMMMHGAMLVSEHISACSWMVCSQQSPLPLHLSPPHVPHLSGAAAKQTTDA